MKELTLQIVQYSQVKMRDLELRGDLRRNVRVMSSFSLLTLTDD